MFRLKRIYLHNDTKKLIVILSFDLETFEFKNNFIHLIPGLAVQKYNLQDYSEDYQNIQRSVKLSWLTFYLDITLHWITHIKK